MNIKKCLTAVSVLVACILATSQLASAAAPHRHLHRTTWKPTCRPGSKCHTSSTPKTPSLPLRPLQRPPLRPRQPAMRPNPSPPSPPRKHPALLPRRRFHHEHRHRHRRTHRPWGYGAELIPMFDSQKIHVYNEGKGGRSSRGYIDEGAWKSVLARMEKGDWVLIQFGHNDTKNSANYPDRAVAPGNGDGMADVDGPNGTKVSPSIPTAGISASMPRTPKTKAQRWSSSPRSRVTNGPTAN